MTIRTEMANNALILFSTITDHIVSALFNTVLIKIRLFWQTRLVSKYLKHLT